MDDALNAKAASMLNRILEMELAGVVRYTHHSFMVFGFGRIPIVDWLRGQAQESMLHAQEAGELITLLGAYPSLGIGRLLDSHQTDIASILRDSLDAEAATLALYRELLETVQGKSVLLEEYARKMIAAEEIHAAEVNKMLRKPGDVAAYRPS
ncbi:MAG: bacterioferritin [Rhodocyclaceae bacterium]|nr:bacterioferritin [Rhodocyclaceae bacterium]